MAQAITQTLIPGKLGASIEICLGTNTQKLYDQLLKCTSYQYDGINYKILLCSAKDSERLNVDVFLADNSIDLPTDYERVQMWLLRESAQLCNVDTVRYIKPNGDLDADLVLHLRLDVQRMMLACNFNRYIVSEVKPKSYNDARIAFPRLYANIITLHQIKVNDIIYDVHFNEIDQLITQYKNWVDREQIVGTLKADDSLVLMIPEWEKILATFPYRNTLLKRSDYDAQSEDINNSLRGTRRDMNSECINELFSEPLVKSEHSNGSKAINLSPDYDDLIDAEGNSNQETWEDTFRILFLKKWTNEKVTKTELRKFHIDLTCSNASSQTVLMMLDSICTTNESFGDATISQRYWYYSSLYELIRMAGIRAATDKKFTNAIGQLIIELSVQYAAERDRQLLLLAGQGKSISRSPSDIPDIQLEDIAINHVFWQAMKG